MVVTWWLVGYISDHNISFRYSSIFLIFLRFSRFSSIFLILLKSLKLVFHHTCISLTWRLQVEVNLTFLVIDRVVIPIFVGLVIYFIKFTPINFWYLETMWDPTILVSQALPSKLLLQNIIIVNWINLILVKNYIFLKNILTA